MHNNPSGSTQYTSVWLWVCRIALLLLTTHTLPTEARGVVTSMLLQALLRPHLSSTESNAQLVGLLDCAVTALLLNLLHFLLLQASRPPAPALIHHVDAILKVSFVVKNLPLAITVLGTTPICLLFVSSSSVIACVLGLSRADLTYLLACLFRL